MKALMIGATGATGHILLQQLLDNPAYHEIHIFVRRHPNLPQSKLHTHLIDFDHPEQWQHKVQGDVLFSCLGTTRKSAGSQQEQWKVDHDYQLKFAQIAQQNNVPSLILISSAFANAESKMFYTRMKGQLENAIRELKFENFTIMRAPALIRPHSDRLGEQWSVNILQKLNQFGLLSQMRPMPVALLADAMICATKLKGEHILEAQQIRELV